MRAQAIWPTGELVQDFHFVEQRNALHVLNAPSPAATASLAIGEEIVEPDSPLKRAAVLVLPDLDTTSTGPSR